MRDVVDDALASTPKGSKKKSPSARMLALLESYAAVDAILFPPPPPKSRTPRSES